jgi:hypothetical protein
MACRNNRDFSEIVGRILLNQQPQIPNAICLLHAKALPSTVTPSRRSQQLQQHGSSISSGAYFSTSRSVLTFSSPQSVDLIAPLLPSPPLVAQPLMIVWQEHADVAAIYFACRDIALVETSGPSELASERRRLVGVVIAKRVFDHCTPAGNVPRTSAV